MLLIIKNMKNITYILANYCYAKCHILLFLGVYLFTSTLEVGGYQLLGPLSIDRPSRV